MIKLELRFKVNRQILKRLDHEQIVEKSRNVVKATFKFTPDWNNLEKFVIFQDTHGRISKMYLGNSNGELSCTVPSNVLRGRFFNVSVYAGDLITSNSVTIPMQHSNYQNDVHFNNRHEKDIFVDIYENLHVKFDDATLDEDNLLFWSNGHLIHSLPLPGTSASVIDEVLSAVRNELDEYDATRTVDTVLDVDSDNPIANGSVAIALATKADINHTHESSDIIDFENGVDTNRKEFLAMLIETLEN